MRAILFDNMKYTPVDFSKVDFKISHEGCWTLLGEELPVKIHTLIVKPQRDKERILGFIEIQSDSSASLGSFVRRLGMHPSVKKVISVTDIAGSKHHCKILFLEKYDQMLSGLLDSYTVLFENDIISGGYENLSVVMPSEEVNSLKQDLQSIGRIFDFRFMHVDEERYLKFNLSLSDSEIEILKIAYSKGYYELPKRTYLLGISKAAGLSKSTVEEHLRKAENRIINSEMVKY